jgi:hypothetical protein
VQVCIICGAGFASRRCLQVSSNVRLHKILSRASPVRRFAMLWSRLRPAPCPNRLVQWWHRIYSVLFRSKETNLSNPAVRAQSVHRTRLIGFNFSSAAIGGVYRNIQFQNQFEPLLSHITSIFPIATRTAKDNVAIANQIVPRKNAPLCFQGKVYVSFRLSPIQSLVARGA